MTLHLNSFGKLLNELLLDAETNPASSSMRTALTEIVLSSLLHLGG